MKTLASISEIFAQHVIETSGRPLMVEASDLKTYLCKHTRNQKANLLFNELLANSFLQLWSLSSPEMVLLNIKREHITVEILSGWIQYANFKKPCLGFEYLQFAHTLSEMDMGIKSNQAAKQKIINKNDLLRIVLFDIWLANEDRSPNNFNLLLNPESQGYRIIPIDHEYIFNSNSPEKDLYPLNEGDSLISTNFFLSLFPKQNRKNIVKLAQQIIEEFKENLVICHENVEQILDNIPDEWNIDVDARRGQLTQIFSSNWHSKSIDTFNSFIQLTYK